MMIKLCSIITCRKGCCNIEMWANKMCNTLVLLVESWETNIKLNQAALAVDINSRLITLKGVFE